MFGCTDGTGSSCLRLVRLAHVQTKRAGYSPAILRKYEGRWVLVCDASMLVGIEDSQPGSGALRCSKLIQNKVCSGLHIKNVLTLAPSCYHSPVRSNNCRLAPT
jgi:hypothetical protein